MYGLKFCDYVPQPKPATSEKIVAAHYYAAWKKDAALVHHGFDDLHDYPARTPLQGYYDGESPEEADWEVKWALEHGVNCFIHCWYRLKDNVGKPVTPSALRLGEGLHEGLFQSRYGDQIRFAIMFEVQNRWGATNATDMTENLMPFWLDAYFTRGNYLLIDNKPVLFVYDFQNQLRDSFANAGEQRKTFDACREMARQRGFDGMLFAIEYRFDDLSVEQDYFDRGYDFIFPYCWSWEKPDPDADYIIDRQLECNRRRLERDPAHYVAAASCMWDPSPRFKTMPAMYNERSFPSLWKLCPEDFRKVLNGVRKLMDAAPQDSIGARMLLLDNWNEWDEGHYILPGIEYGFGYLQAVREEFTARDNLPDYRMPEQLGTNKLNTCWDEPDFSAFPPEHI